MYTSTRLIILMAFTAVLGLEQVPNQSETAEDDLPEWAAASATSSDFEAADLVRAAPWWEQQEEAAKRRCQSSCTMHSKGVKQPQITLCDDAEVRILEWVRI